MAKKYRFANSQWLPTRTYRQANIERVKFYSEDKFEAFVDWFFFIHIDPVFRFWHALGFFVGLFLYGVAIVLWSWASIPVAILGMAFFYGMGLLSHYVYEGGLTKSDIPHWHETTPAVVRIVLGTAFGFYENDLEAFIEKYPFTIDAYSLTKLDPET